MIVWAVRMRYLSSKDDKWHRRTTKWYSSSADAWQDKETFERANKDILECASSLVHKENIGGR